MKNVSAKMGRLPLKDIANKLVTPTSLNEVVQVCSKIKIPPFGTKVVHGRVGLVLQGYRMNVMTHGLERRPPELPLGIEVQSAYVTLAMGSNRVAVVIRNTTRDWVEIKKNTPITQMEAANQVPPVSGSISVNESDNPPTLTEAERQALLMDKLDLTGLESWPEEQAS